MLKLTIQSIKDSYNAKTEDSLKKIADMLLDCYKNEETVCINYTEYTSDMEKCVIHFVEEGSMTLSDKELLFFVLDIIPRIEFEPLSETYNLFLEELNTLYVISFRNSFSGEESEDKEETENLSEEASNENEGKEVIRHPKRYAAGGKHNIECYKAMEYVLEHLQNVPPKYYGHVTNVIKYIWRCNYKNGYADLDKASAYLDFMFED